MIALRRILPVLIAASVPAWGQLQTDTITITANREVNLQPDQIVFSLQLQAPEAASLDDVLAQVAGVGITAANLVSVFSLGDKALAWTFNLPALVSQASATTASLLKLAQQSKQPLTFSVLGTQVSQALQQSQPCSQASLVSDARAQAQNLAAAAGFSVGPVLAVSDGSLVPVAPRVIAGALPAFLTVTGFLADFVSTPPQPITCAAAVKFQLYRYH